MKSLAIMGLSAILLCSTNASARETLHVGAPPHDVKVDIFSKKTDKTRPAVIIVSGGRGFASTAYDELGNMFASEGIDVYLAHLLSSEDLRFIAEAKDARERISYYKKRRGDWVSDLAKLTSQLNDQNKNRKLGILGISLGAETTVMAISQGLRVDAAVLVDGVPSNALRLPARGLPPLHLIWGRDDTVFPLTSAQIFLENVRHTGATATLSITDGAKHDFFLKAGTAAASNAHRDALSFFQPKLSAE